MTLRPLDPPEHAVCSRCRLAPAKVRLHLTDRIRGARYCQPCGVATMSQLADWAARDSMADLSERESAKRLTEAS